MSNNVWFVTGASAGLGLDLVGLLLSNTENKYQVVATTRSVEKLKTELKKRYQLEDAKLEQSLLVLQVDLTSQESVNDSVKKSIEKFGKIDVVVNNAGYGLAGAIEELTDKETREQFDVNVFGLLNVIRATLPALRESTKGKELKSRIYNISSIAGSLGFPGLGIYCASKFAVTGISESLSAELQPQNISVTHVDPGYFNTDFLAKQSFVLPKTELPNYEQVREIINKHANEINHKQPGDPKKGMAILIKLANQPNPPVRLLLGSDAVQLQENILKSIQKEVDQYREISSSTNYDQ